MMISRQSYSVSGIITLYFFFLVSLVLHTLASPKPHYCRHDQRDALLEFKHEFPVNESNPNPLLSSWNKSSDCCAWEGIECDAKSGQVISLYLNSIPLNSYLKPNSGLFKLHHLGDLTLKICGLYGEIPTSFANFTNLSSLVISGNQFTGGFPLALLNLTTTLSTLVISYNLFKSTLPPDMSRFHKLEDFDVTGNSFFGPFPSSLFMIPSLTSVNLARNQFEGPIEFRNTSSSSKLQMLYLVKNKFDGPFPISILKFPNLIELFLSDNNFSGPIPISVSKLHYFKDIDLSNNKLEGQIPGWLRGVRRLKLSHNSFSSFEKSFEVFKVLEWDLDNRWMLDLSSNSFKGPLPYWICKIRPPILPTYQPQLILDLSNNNFSGSIPQCLTNSIAALATLNLQNNNLSNILPDVFFNATSLMSFDISGNQLEGKLPKSLINCTSLKLLNVASNRFKDEFPSWLGSLPRLNVLILRSNELYGPLYHPHESTEFQSLRIIDISHNHFNGTLLPFYFSNCPEMTTVPDKLIYELEDEDYDIDSNYMGHIGYDSMEMVNKGVDKKFERIRQDFTAIDFSGNNFCGEIPKSIGLLKQLRLLNLSGNSLTSNIPQSLANLTNLEALDLSRNQLSGQIPRNLGTLFSLAIMNFSHNNLQGPIPRGTQFQSQNCSSFMGNPKLYGLEDVCGETHVPSPTPQESEDLSEPEEQAISWIAAAIAYGPGVFCGLVIGHIFSSRKHKWFM